MVVVVTDLTRVKPEHRATRSSDHGQTLGQSTDDIAPVTPLALLVLLLETHDSKESKRKPYNTES